MISKRISDGIPPQIKTLNIVIPILMHFCSFVSNWSVALINDIKQFLTVYHRIYCLKFLTLSNQLS